MPSAQLRELIDFYQSLTPERVGELRRFYAPEAYFKDPFNEVRGVAQIERIFDRMFRQISQPRFVVTHSCAETSDCFLVWELRFTSRRLRGGPAQTIRGASHLRFDSSGKVACHRDYWDAAGELYARLPALGWLMRLLRRLAQ
jgi:hypothetical protein